MSVLSRAIYDCVQVEQFMTVLSRVIYDCIK